MLLTGVTTSMMLFNGATTSLDDDAPLALHCSRHKDFHSS